MPKNDLKKNYLVTKSNPLNEMRASNMTMQELRLLSVYLSKINPFDKGSRHVYFSITEFQAIMELGRININYYKKVAESLLSKVIFVPTDKGGFKAFTLFNAFEVDSDEDDKWYVRINANDEIMPLMFDLKKNYFKYELWNALRLRGKNQLRMYEVLKQHEKLGYRIISISDLKGMLGIAADEYPQYKIFRRDVLESCRKVLSEDTDISYTYEPHSKKGRKVHELKFIITKNKDFKSPLGLEKFIDLAKEKAIEGESQEIDFDDTDENGIVRATGRHRKYEERITVLAEACMNEFSREQIAMLFDRMPDFVKYDENTSSDYLQSKYLEMEMRKPERSRFGYLVKIISEAAGAANA